MFQKLWNDELGVIISAELVLVMTIAVLAMVVGLHALSKTIVQELNDLAQAFGAVDQTYHYNGLKVSKGYYGAHAAIAGSGFKDRKDDCDCSPVDLTPANPKVDSSNSGEPESGGNSY